MRLIIGNSESKVEGLSREQHKALSTLLSYEVNPQAAYFSGGFVRKSSLLDKHGAFPSGLLDVVKRWFGASQVEYIDTRVRPNARQGLYNFRLHLTPYPEQENAVAGCLEALRGTVSMPTGTGKSVTMALLINKLQVRTLVVVPNLELKRQLESTFKSIFGPTKDIVVENVDSPKLNQLTDFDCLIIDEAHHVAAKTYRKLNKRAWGGIYYRYFFTATPFRVRDEEQLLMESVAGRVIYRLDYPTAVAKGFIVPIQAYYIDIPKKAHVKGQTWAEVYSELVVNNKERNDIISNILANLDSAGVSTLCLVKEIAHGELLSNKTGIHFVKGENENNRQMILEFNLRERNSLIGTTGVLGEGVDTKPAEYVIVAGLGKAKGAFMQQCGRGVRTYPGKEAAKIILLRDKSHRWCLKHYREQCKVLLDEYGVKPVKLE